MLYFLVKRDHAHFIDGICRRLDKAAGSSVGTICYEDLIDRVLRLGLSYRALWSE